MTNPMTILSFAAIFAGLGVVGGSGADAALLTLGVFCGSASWWVVLTAAMSAAPRSDHGARTDVGEPDLGRRAARVRHRRDRDSASRRRHRAESIREVGCRLAALWHNRGGGLGGDIHIVAVDRTVGEALG